MNVTNFDLVGSVDALRVLAGMKLPVKAAFNISKVVKAADVALKEFEEARVSLINIHKQEGTDADEKGNVTLADPDSFRKDYNDLLQVDLELPVRPIAIDDLGSIEVEPQLMAQLSWLITA
jgi:hypothetical protein